MGDPRSHGWIIAFDVDGDGLAIDAAARVLARRFGRFTRGRVFVDPEESRALKLEHLGIAVDSPRGLLVPVIHNAGDLNLGGMARKIADLAERTRTNKVSPDDKGVFGSFNLQNEFDKIQGLFSGMKVFSWVVAIWRWYHNPFDHVQVEAVIEVTGLHLGLPSAHGAYPAVWLFAGPYQVAISAVALFAADAIAAVKVSSSFGPYGFSAVPRIGMWTYLMPSSFAI